MNRELETNYNRLKKFIQSEDSYHTYKRLIEEFKEFMPEEERRDLIDKAKGIFVEEQTKDWE
jgi:hypothetical protein